jgi:hypothetical protein
VEEVVIRYRYRFENGVSKEIEARLNGDTLSLVPFPDEDFPSWTLLENHRCPTCRLDPAEHPYCPVAVNLIPVVREFGGLSSCEEVEVTVETEQRSCVKQTFLWEGVSSLAGIIMAASGCPGLDRLKPLVRFHLPFASVEETGFRVLSLSLIAAFLRRRRGEPVTEDLDGLHELYGGVAAINAAFANRLRAAAEKDAHVNALVNLDVYAQLVPLTMEELLDGIEPSFAAWFSPA